MSLTSGPEARTVVTLPAPCTMPVAEQSSTALTSALPMLAGLGSMVMVAGMSGVGQARTFVAGGFFLLSTALVIATQVARQRRQHQNRVDEARTAFVRELDAARNQLEESTDRQRRRLEDEHPTLESWLGTVSPPPRDSTSVRLGTATVPAALDVLITPAADPERADPFATQALDVLAARGTLVEGAPLVVDLAMWREVVITTAGATTAQVSSAVRDRARHLLCQAVVSRPPDALQVVLACAPERWHHWEWMKWLPHHRSTTDRDVTAGRRLLLDEDAPPPLGRTRATLVVLDGDVDLPVALTTAPDTTVLRIDAERRDPERTGSGPGSSGHRSTPGRAELRLGSTTDVWATPDSETSCRATGCSQVLASVVARRLDRRQPATTDSLSARLDDLPGMLGVNDVRTWDTTSWWSQLTPEARLRVPIGLDLDGAPVHLDLKESAQGGDGPHGLVVGATGSGKSELLRTLVLGLALQHAPEELGMVLVDFKGGATFAGFGDLPHVAAVVTNLGDDLALVDRMADTLTGELVRRQELLRATGHASLAEHRAARHAGADLAPLPSLFVCIDEFSELLAARPEFVDVFVAIGRVGRSLGVHLLLASQRVEEGRLRGLETHLSYRIGLRTFSAAESRAAIGVPDAHALPPTPGAGYLATGAGAPTRFTAAYVSGPPPRPTPSTPAHRRPLPWTLLPVPDPPNQRTALRQVSAPAPSTSTVDLVVERSRHLPRTRRVWLPPMTVPQTLGNLLGDVTHSPDRGLHSPAWTHVEGRRVPVGLVDRPREQRRDVWGVDLSGAAGHCAVVGGPHSGRTTTLQTIVTGLALTATPTELQLLLLDFGGGGLAPLAGLPHVIGSGARGDAMLARVVAEATGLLERREAWFRAEGLDSLAAYATRRACGAADDGFGEVFVVVDGWNVLRHDDHETEAALHRIAERGLTFGIHLVVATHRWSDLRPTLRDQFGSRVELRLGDPMDSMVDRRRAATVPLCPGHGVVDGGYPLLTALPALPVAADMPRPTDPLGHLVAAVAHGWSGARPRRLAPLPERVDLASLRQAWGDGPPLLGHDGDTAVALPDSSHRHLLVRGGAGTGRSTVLRTYLQELQRCHDPASMQVVLVDPHGKLDETVDPGHLLHHLVGRTQTSARLAELATYLRGRLPGPDVTAEEWRARSWWKGAEVTVVVDDHDRVTAGGWQECGLHLLAPLVPQAREVGLHVVVAQRDGRGRMGDPLVQALQDLEVPTLELAGAAPPGRARLTTRGRAAVTLQVASPLDTHHPAVGWPPAPRGASI